MKATIRDLAKFIGKTEQTLYHKRKVSPNEFKILLVGWKAYCESKR